MKRRTRWYHLAAVAALAALFACSEEIESDPESSPPEDTRPTLASTRAATELEAGYRTYLYSERDVDVFSRLGSGEFFEQGVVVTAIHVEVGDQVAAGQLLAVLEDDEVQLELEAAQAKAEEARNHFERVEELSQQELVSPSEYDGALYAKRYAEAELERARLDLSRTRVRAPFDGVVARRYIRVAERVEEGTPLFRITAMTPLRARLLVPEREAATFRLGAPVRLVGSTGETATARVVVVGPTIDPASGTREVVVELANPNGFRPGAEIVVEPVLVQEVEER